MGVIGARPTLRVHLPPYRLVIIGCRYTWFALNVLSHDLRVPGLPVAVIHITITREPAQSLGG